MVCGSLILPTVVYSYYYICNQIDKNSSLIKQTIHNLNRMHKLRAITGGGCEIVSSVTGEMLQRKGTADISFHVKCNSGSFSVSAIAHRQGINWKTDNLVLFQNGQECAVLSAEDISQPK